MLHHLFNFSKVDKMKPIRLTLFILLLSYSLSAQITAKIDTNLIELGDQTNLTFIVDSKGQKVVFPDFKNNEISKNVSIVESYPLEKIKNKPNSVKKKYRIAFFDDSVQTIEPFAVLVGKDTLYSPEINVFVEKVKIDSATAAKIDTTMRIPGIDVKQPMTVKFTFKEFMQRFGRWILLGLLIALLIGIVIWIIIRYKKNKPIKILQKPAEPPHIIAYRELDQLKAKKLYEKGQVKEYYSELTNIVRKYIEQRFRIKAMEQTTSEILNSFEATKVISKELMKLMEELLSMSDMAKFAKYVPFSEQSTIDWNKTRDFVEQTMEKEEEQTTDSEILKEQ